MKSWSIIKVLALNTLLMGMENFGSKPAASKTEETRSWVNPITGEEELVPAEPAHAESIAAEEPTTPEVDTSFVEMAGEKPVVANEQAPVVPIVSSEQVPAPALSPERKAEVMEQVGKEETKLGENIVVTNKILEKVTNGPSAKENLASAHRESLLKTAKIKDAYEKMQNKVNVASAALFTGGVVTMTAGFFAKMQNMNYDMTTGWVSNGSLVGKLGQVGFETGVIAGGAAAGAFLVGHALNKLGTHMAERKEEKKRQGLFDRFRGAAA